jgi:sialic acid synthase SpsE
MIAEAGSNFNQSLDTAKRLIDVAHDSGAQAVKFQLFRADALYPNGGELYDIFKSVELNADWVPILDRHARERGLTFLASVFDLASFRVLEDISVAAHKVASSETTNMPLLLAMAATGKPLFISTGMCDMVDVEMALDACAGVGNTRVGLFQCGARYPLPVEEANLRVIDTFLRRFNCPTGFSDHTLGLGTAVAAVGLGATIFEKHFTLDRQSKGPDHFYALEPAELKAYVSGIQEAFTALGSPEKQMLDEERRLGRRDGLYAARRINAGDAIGPDDIAVRRPAVGLRARYRDAVLGLKVAVTIEEGEPLTWAAVRPGGK